MIKIIKKDELLLIKSPVTDFIGSISYCEYRIPFYIKGIKPEYKEAEIRKNIGLKGHLKEEKLEIEKIDKGEIRPTFDIELFWLLSDSKNDIEFIRERLNTKFSYNTQIDEKNIKLILNGRADKVKRKDECLIIQEDKFPRNPFGYIMRDRPFDSQILQTMIYLNSKFSNDKMFNWFEIPHRKKQWIINIRHSENKENTENTNTENTNTENTNTENKENTENTNTENTENTNTENTENTNTENTENTNTENTNTENTENNIIKSFEGIVEENDMTYMEGNLFRFISLVIGKKEKIRHNNLNKCMSCDYVGLCQHSLA